MTYKIRYIGMGVLLMAIVIAAYSFVFIAHGNPSFFIRKGTNATLATTTQAFLTPGAATTTSPTFDLGVGGAQGADSAVLALAMIGSSTPTGAVSTTTYNVAIEYSQDNIDWYGDGMYPATTSSPVGVSGTKVHTVSLGTQTTGGSLTASTTPTRVLFEVPTPTRYVRAVISLPLIGNAGVNNANGAIYAEFIAKRQNP